jgi:hypothetical protein
VVSSLPLAIMDDELVERILNASRDSLVPDGRFIQYQYSLSRYARVRAHYPSVALAFTSLNVPPAFVYTCTKRPGTFRRGWRRPLVGSVYGGALMLVAMLARVVHDL